MKKLMIFAGAVAMTLFACQNDNQFKLVGKDLPQAMNGKYAYLYQGDSIVDSIKVNNGKCTYVSAVDTMNVYTLDLAGQHYMFIKDPGQISIIKQDSTDGGGYKLAGGKYTAKLYDLITEKHNVNSKLEHFQPDKSLSQEKNQENFLNMFHDVLAKYNGTIREYYEKNKTNAVGVFAFNSISFDDNDSLLISLYEAAPANIKENKEIKTKYEIALNKKKTEVGAQYSDFEMVNEKGDTIKLSNYMVPKDYLLIDFWASWCGPCRRAMPHLADLHKKYDKKGLNILSIGTWDKAEDYNKAVEDLKIVWGHILDSNSTGAKTYGVDGIPTMVLISPEGKILARTHNPEEISEQLENIFKK